ncbi:ABC transporter permease/M1 family aminopeptidase [Candidatus Viadribacter manganicus]|uniref:Aminopeptidase n=1 Tax=Candidatus Viadribacter manganicus TaxID=1759059 RepID=A0A1B1AGH2_9PROT|nr:M1 family aminopeptidase [Candidatus Viadribacter manganicus]ANP45654.1 aminopeptidase [Candidatus Viadribacter manganicus]
MFGKIAGFELRYQLKSPVLWIVFLFFFLMTFFAVSSDNVSIGGGGGNIHENSPFSIIMSTAVMAIFAQFVVVAFVANVILRDVETGFGPIIQSTRMTKFDYLFGRFTGAFMASMIVLTAVPIGMMVGSFMPWVDPETMGPFVPMHYLYGYFVAGVPTLFLCACMFFALATLTRSMMGSYIGLVVFLVLYFVMQGIFNRPEHEDLVTLLEPYGLGAIVQETRYWTAAERNTLLPPLSSQWLINRGIWMGVALVSLGAAYLLFSFSSKGSKASRKRAKLDAQTPSDPLLASAGHAARRSFSVGAALSQVLARARFEFGYVLRGPAFIVLLMVGLLNAYGALWYADTIRGDIIVYPVTMLMTQALMGSFTIFPIIIATYYAGELVWRDREKRMHEIVDTTPAPDWTFAAPKVLALFAVLAACIGVSVVAGVLVQMLKGFGAFNIGQYMLWYVLPSLFSCFTFAALAIFAQVLTPHKFIGWGVMLVYLIGTITLSQLGFDHNLYLYGATPSAPLSEMNEHSHYWIGVAWFQLYWSIFALVLIVLTYALWRRGADTRLLPQLVRLPQRLAGGAGVLVALLAVSFASVGGWIYYNTNVLNEYRSNLASEARLADMERALLQYEDAPQPKVTDVVLSVQVFPRQHRAVTTGSYTVENRTGAPLTEVHLMWPQDLELDSVAIDGATLADDFAEHAQSFPFQIWRLDTPMQPQERREIRFTTRYEARGFTNGGGAIPVNNNGTFMNDRMLAPVLGFDRSGLLQDRARRRRYGLEPDLRMARLEDDAAREFHYLRHDADWVNADITVTTDEGQIPIAPGYEVSQRTENGRVTARFRTEAPIMHFFSIQSADYEVARDRYNNIDLAVYYDRHHPYNVERMMRAMKVSFEVFEREFSPFQFRQMRILEFPAYAQFAQSFANTVPYSEAIGFIARYDDATAERETEKVDYVTYVTAHEVAHQWWAHQIIGADMQGSTMLSETFASYSALLVMEEILGPDQVRRFLRQELDNYLRSRGGEVIEELPLMRVENQGYIHYRKGGLAMYFLRNEVGEDAVNRAMQRLLEEYAFHGAPYPRSSDFVRILREEVGPNPAHQALITDLFERITLYDARVVSAETRARADGRWDVTMVVEARKLYADGEGAETEAPLNEAFEFGIFTAEPGEGAFSRDDVITFERRPIRSGRQTISFTVDREPTFAGIDPYNKRIDRNSDDNVLAVTVSDGAPPA